jgi:hypothetical protein
MKGVLEDDPEPTLDRSSETPVNEQDRRAKPRSDPAQRHSPGLTGFHGLLEHPSAVRDRVVDVDQHHPPLCVGKAEDQDFGNRPGNLLGREVDHRCDLAPDQLLGRVQLGDRGRSRSRGRRQVCVPPGSVRRSAPCRPESRPWRSPATPMRPRRRNRTPADAGAPEGERPPPRRDQRRHTAGRPA